MATQQTHTFQEFLRWEATSRDTIDFKRIYVHMTGDLMAGLFLSQIVYWNLPKKDGDSKLRVWKNGEQWLAKTDYEWYDEICASPYQARRVFEILEEQGFIVTDVFRFNGAPTRHIFLNKEKFLERFKECQNTEAINPWRPNHQQKKEKLEIVKQKKRQTKQTPKSTENSSAKKTKKKISDLGENHKSICGKTANPFMVKPQIHSSENRKSLTETTAKTTSEITAGITEVSSAPEGALQRASFLTKKPFSLTAEKIHTLIKSASGDLEILNRAADWWLVHYHQQGKQSNPFALMFKAITNNWDLEEDAFRDWGTAQQYG